jgi:hypothetical protein
VASDPHNREGIRSSFSKARQHRMP